MFFVKLSFIVGGVLSSVVRDTQRRRRFRGKFNLFCLRPYIARFIKRAYGEKIESLKFIRQQSMNRIVGLVNGKYYVKIFRNISVSRIRAFAELMDIIENTVSVVVPHVIADDKISMYSYTEITGVDINDFSREVIIKNKTKILKQLKQFIEELQSINVKKIPHYERFLTDIYGVKYGNPTKASKKLVLEHFDVNLGNFLYDKKLNITSVIDWDTVAITDDVNGSWDTFMRYWNKRYEQ